MTPYNFTKVTLEGCPIQVFNHGNMGRAFTYISNITLGVVAALDR